MAVCTMEALAVGNAGRGLAAVEGGGSARRDGLVAWSTSQRVVVSARVERRWPSVVGPARVEGARLRFRCHATEGDGPPKKNYDLNEVIEKVVDEEKDQLPDEEKRTPEPLPEGEPHPFSPAIETDDTEAFQGEGVSKDSLIEPPRGLQEGAASASIGEGLGATEESALSADIGGSSKSGPGGHGRDWRVQATDEGSSFMAEAGILENDEGKSVYDYKLRARIFSESAVFFSALKKRQSHSVV